MWLTQKSTLSHHVNTSLVASIEDYSKLLISTANGLRLKRCGRIEMVSVRSKDMDSDPVCLSDEPHLVNSSL